MKNKLLSPLLILFSIGLVSAQEVFEQVTDRLFSTIFSGVLFFGIAVLIVGVLVAVMWYFFLYKRKFDITVKIFSERASDKNNIIFDKAAILKDRKTGTKYFKLWSLKEELLSPPFNILQITNKGDYLELRRTAENRWYYLYPPQISKKYLMKSDGKVYPVAEQKTINIDMDLDYWAAKRKSQNRSMFAPEKLWIKLFPYVPIVLGIFGIIFVLYILMSYLPEILSEMRSLAAELNRRSTAVVTTGTSMIPLIFKWKKK